MVLKSPEKAKAGRRRGDLLRSDRYLNNHKSRRNETEYSSLGARRRLYAGIVNEHYKEKKAKARAQAWLDMHGKTKKET